MSNDKPRNYWSFRETPSSVNIARIVNELEEAGEEEGIMSWVDATREKRQIFLFRDKSIAHDVTREMGVRNDETGRVIVTTSTHICSKTGEIVLGSGGNLLGWYLAELRPEGLRLAVETIKQRKAYGTKKIRVTVQSIV